MESLCSICNKKVKKFISCSSAHKFHENCLKRLMNDSLFSFLNNCENCVNELPLKIKYSGQICIFCREKGLTSECNFRKRVCKPCSVKYVFRKHYLDCDICSGSFCTECNGKIKLKIASRADKCKQHNLCINHLILKNDCSDCDYFVNKFDLNCKICCDLVTKNNIHCDSGHFYCDSCIEHFGFTGVTCTDCYKVFNLDSEYEREKATNRDLSKTYFLNRVGHLRCFKCSEYQIFRTYQHPSCNRCYFCPLCINNCTSKDPHLDSGCKFFFTELKKFEILIVVCHICKLPPDGSSKFCEQGHYLCLNCRMLLISANKIAFKRIINCISCVKELRALREFVKIYEPEADRTIIKAPIYSFTCGHILKFDQYRIRITSQILSFISHLRSQNVEILNQGLNIYCDSQHCQTRIVFDFNSILPILKIYLPPDYDQDIQTIQTIFNSQNPHFELQEGRLIFIN